ncbi:MAG: methyltransferase, partial [Nitrospirota bacterium]|nr:methyltransferase [Nitrospirota bacterium]
VTRRTIQEVGLEGRIALLPGNFLSDSFQGPYDIALMSDILHYQDGKTNAALVQKVYHHLVEGGRLVIKDRFLDPSRTSPAWTTAFAVHILVNTERGQCFTSRDAMTWMEESGFQSVMELEPRAVLQGMKL